MIFFQPWRFTTPLPSTLWLTKGSNLNGYFHLSGGQFDYNQSFNVSNEILRWDHDNLDWEVVGHMVNEHLAEQLGEVYRRDRNIILKVEECDSRIRIYVSLFL